MVDRRVLSWSTRNFFNGARGREEGWESNGRRRRKKITPAREKRNSNQEAGIQCGASRECGKGGILVNLLPCWRKALPNANMKTGTYNDKGYRETDEEPLLLGSIE